MKNDQLTSNEVKGENQLLRYFILKEKFEDTFKRKG